MSLATRLLNEIESKAVADPRSLNDFLNKQTVKTFGCPSCGKCTLNKSSRLVRGLLQERLRICVKCYNLGPTAVGDNLRERENG